MRARRLAAMALLVSAALAGGCLKRSPAARTYVLDPLPGAPATTPAAAAVAVVGVERVRVPDWLDRPQVAGRAASGEVVADEFSRWAEPLSRGLQRVVTENLVLLLPDRRIVPAPFPPRDLVDHFVEITVLEAARQADGSVLLDCRWTVLARDGAVLARRRSSHRASPTALGASGAVLGLNEALASLSRELADVLREQAPPKEQAPPRDQAPPKEQAPKSP